MAAIGAGLLSLGLPKANLAPLGLVGLTLIFWAWFGLSPRGAFWTGWISGILYFSATFGWFGETAGAYVAPYGFALVLLPAILEALAFALAGAATAYAWTAGRRTLAPLAGAAAFAALEWLRSSGPLGVPFGNLSYAYVQTPLAPVAAFAGSFGLTFVVCAIAAYLAYAARSWRDARAPRIARDRAARDRRRGDRGVGRVARASPPARDRTGSRASREHRAEHQVDERRLRNGQRALRRADALGRARQARADPVARNRRHDRPQPRSTAAVADHAARPAVARRVARRSQELAPEGEYNALYYFRPDGTQDGTYRKRRLVPFVEQLPAEGVLGKLPFASLVSRFRSGTSSGVRTIDGLRIAPMICWESAFDGVAQRAIADGAQAFVVATDDAWFGKTAGPYQHAQIAQMRALETGSWIVRAAATGISGIIAPNGRYTQATALDRVAVVQGTIGPPAGAPYPHIGAVSVGIALLVLYAIAFVRRGAR